MGVNRIGKATTRQRTIEPCKAKLTAGAVQSGETWIPGYKPAFNFQMSLAEAVARWMDRNQEYLARAP